MEIDKLAYFGASIFWRASVYDWWVGKDKHQRIPLGPYQDALRLYLLGKSSIPDGIVLLVTLSSALDNFHNRVAAMPWLFDRKPEYRSYKFIVPGLTFQLFAGRLTPKPIRRICSARYGFLYMNDESDADMLKMMATIAKQVQRKGKLAVRPESIKRDNS